MTNDTGEQTPKTDAEEVLEAVEAESTDETPQQPEADVSEEETPEEAPEQSRNESIEDYKKRIATLEAQKNHFREKAERREALQTSTRADMSPADLVAVMQAGVHADDMERVERFAIAEGISIKEAVRNPELQAMLDVRNEQRQTAVATNVENVRRGASVPSADSLMQRASKGDIPSSDDEIEALVSAKMNYKN